MMGNFSEMLHKFIFILTVAGFSIALKTLRCKRLSCLCHFIVLLLNLIARTVELLCLLTFGVFSYLSLTFLLDCLF